jgi:hypothetical protein
MAKVTSPNQFSLAVGHRTTAKVDDRILPSVPNFRTILMRKSGWKGKKVVCKSF